MCEASCQYSTGIQSLKELVLLWPLIWKVTENTIFNNGQIYQNILNLYMKTEFMNCGIKAIRSDNVIDTDCFIML